MISGYPNNPSVLQGHTLTLHISTDAPSFQVEFYRQEKTLTLKSTSDPLVGRQVPPACADVDWEWPNYEFLIPSEWPSGAYLVLFIELDSNGRRISSLMHPIKGDENPGRALFVVRSANPGKDASIIYKLPLFTYHAYNYSGDGSLYYGGSGWVTTRRVGGGSGGPIQPGDPPDVYDLSSRRQTFAHWDSPMISWLYDNDYKVDYCTDLDLHFDDGLLQDYQLLLSAGHDEYWSDNMRKHVDQHLNDDGNVAFLGGNTCWRRIEFRDNSTTVFRRTDPWWKTYAENSLTGVSYRNGAGWWGPLSGKRTKRSVLGYIVQHTDHWIFEGTGLRDGDRLGWNQEPPLIGYECDGAVFTRDSSGQAVPTTEDGTPNNFEILAVAELTPLGDGAVTGWCQEPRELAVSHLPPAATMGLFSRGGCVFTASTTDWPKVLHRGNDLNVRQITRNVLNKLGNETRKGTGRKLG